MRVLIRWFLASTLAAALTYGALWAHGTLTYARWAAEESLGLADGLTERYADLMDECAPMPVMGSALDKIAL